MGDDRLDQAFAEHRQSRSDKLDAALSGRRALTASEAADAFGQLLDRRRADPTARAEDEKRRLGERTRREHRVIHIPPMRKVRDEPSETEVAADMAGILNRQELPARERAAVEPQQQTQRDDAVDDGESSDAGPSEMGAAAEKEFQEKWSRLDWQRMQAENPLLYRQVASACELEGRQLAAEKDRNLKFCRESGIAPREFADAKRIIADSLKTNYGVSPQEVEHRLKHAPIEAWQAAHDAARWHARGLGSDDKPLPSAQLQLGLREQYGVDQETIDRLWPHFTAIDLRIVSDALRECRHADRMARRREPRRAAKEKNPPPASALERAGRRLARSGSLEDAASFFEQLLPRG